MHVIKNVTTVPIFIDGVSIEPGRQLSIAHLTADMIAARDRGDLQVKSADTTLEERRADTAAIKPFKTGDHAIDG